MSTPHRPNIIKAFAALRGETLADTARAVDVTPAVLYMVCGGRTHAWPALRQRLDAHFNVPEEDLFHDEVVS